MPPLIAEATVEAKRGRTMQAIEIETQIDKNGHISLPAEYQYAYGKSVRLLVLLTEEKETQKPRRRPGSERGILFNGLR